MRAKSIVPLLLALTGNIHCQTRSQSQVSSEGETSNLQMTPEEKSQGKDLVELIKKNSPQSREEAARALEVQGKALLDSQDPQAALLREFTFYTIKALRVGADKLCADADKITVYRGNDSKSVWRTMAGKPFFAANYFLGGGKHFGHALRQYAQKKIATNGEGAEEAFSPHNFDKLASRHTRAIDPLLSPFISTTNTSTLATSFGDTTFTIKTCPGRIPSTSDQGWAEQEMLAQLFILPEEIVAETPSSSVKYEVTPIGSCYAPDIGIGSRAHAKLVDLQTFNGWNQIVLKALASERSSGTKANWNEIQKTFLTQCNCAVLIRKKNLLYLAEQTKGGPLYDQDEECADYPNFKAQKFIYVTDDRATLKSGLASANQCSVKRGTSFAFETLTQENAHHKFSTKEAMPQGCQSLGNAPIYLSTEYSAVR